jgi:phage-related protein
MGAEVTVVFKGQNAGASAVARDVAGDVRGIGTAAESANGQAGGFFRGMMQSAGGFLTANIIGGITSQIGGLAAGMVNGNAQFESYNVQFGVMLGSAELAKQRMAELAQFGASTPFELPQVVEADKVLQGFGLHSLESAQKFGFSGEQIRTIAGDVASGTGTSFQEMALNIGKFSTGATGEAIARFMELGILTRDELAKMGVEFSKSGELVSPLPEATEAMLQLMQSKYGGMMQAQSTTFDGMRSNLADWVGAATRIMGAPIFDVLKENLSSLLGTLSSNGPAINAVLTSVGTVLANVLGGAITFISQTAIPAMVAAWNMISPAVRSAWTALQAIGIVFRDLAQAAQGWGQNIVVQLANGIMAAAASVINSLGYIGGIITEWLMPHSPPKLLPDLDTWGADAATVYMDGWAQGDFSAFNDLSGQIRQQLESLVDVGALAPEGVIPALMGSRTVIAEIIAEITSVGTVSEDAFGRLAAAAGPAGDVAVQLMRGYVSVETAARNVASAQVELEAATSRTADAQAYLTSVTAEYDAELAPLNSQLDETRAQLDAVRDAKRLQALEAIVSDETKSEQEREQARLEMQEIQIQNLIDAKEREKAGAVDAAQKTVEAAQAEERAAQNKLKAAQAAEQQAQNQYAATQAMIQVQRDNSSLMTEQVELLRSLAEKAGGAGSALTGAAGGAGSLGGGLAGLTAGTVDLGANLDALAPKVSPAEEAFTNLKDRMWEAADGASANLTPAIQMAGDIMAFLRDRLGEVQTFIQPVVDTLTTGFSEGGVTGAISAFLGVLGQISPTFELVKGVFDAALPPIQSIVTSVFGIISEFINTNGADILATIQSTWNSVQGIIDAILPPIQSIVSTVFGAIATFLTTHGGEIQGILQMAWDTIKTVIDGVLVVINGLIVPAFTAIATFITENSAAITGILDGAWGVIKGIVETAMGIIQGIIQTVTSLIQGDWEGVWNGISTIFSSVWSGIQTVVDGALTAIQNAISLAWNAVSTVFSTVWDGIKTAFEGVWTGLTDGVKTAVDTIKTTITDAWEAITTATSNLFTNIGTGIGNAFDSVVGVMKGIVNSAIDVVNSIIGGLNDVSNALGFGNAVDPIPKLAKGTNWWPGGFAEVSEGGRLEFARLPGIGQGLLMPGAYRLPRGSQVIPHDQTMRMLGGQGGGVAAGGAARTVEQHDHYHLTINSNAQTESLASQFQTMRQLRSRS